jgi:hypothetical protein
MSLSLATQSSPLLSSLPVHRTEKQEYDEHTIRMPQSAQEPHHRRTQRVVLRELQLRGEYAAFEGGALGPLDQRFPDEHVVFGDGAGGYAVGGVGGEVFVLVEEALLGD